ncbi:hypothetical protein MMC27_008301 [Xylographa pallens]|nr:hypothetical protein [Xylographa pallens]
MRNAAQSPLLKLPLEIRSKIWREVLGDHDVHIVKGLQWRIPGSVSDVYDAYAAVNFGSNKPLRHYICIQEQSVVATYQRWKADMENGFAKPVDHGKHNNECITEFQCHMCDHPFFCQAKKLHGVVQWERRLQLALLRTCRQIYVEANEVLWGTNTFSFGSTRLLKEFMAQRNATQKQLLKKIHVKWDNSSISVRLPIATIKALSGVRVLHLNMASTFSQVHAENSISRNVYIDSVQVLRMSPPLEVVTVIFDTQTRGPNRIDNLPPTQQLEIAEGIRSRLLAPNGLERL